MENEIQNILIWPTRYVMNKSDCGSVTVVMVEWTLRSPRIFTGIYTAFHSKLSIDFSQPYKGHYL
jgi:hypothetical protein